MTVKELISILKKTKDPDLAQITIYAGDKYFEIKSIGQFGLITDVSIEIMKVDSPSKVSYFRRDKQKMVEKTLRKIKKELK